MAKVPTPPQFVLLAFDGSNEPEFWSASRKFAAGAGVRFTYFVSGVYFLLTEHKNDYIDALGRPGKSNIGFGGTLDMMKKRLEQVRLAMAEGHEIGSHAIGHFDGAKYLSPNGTRSSSNSRIFCQTSGSDTTRPPSLQDGRIMSPGGSGFRAPYLAVGDRKALWKTLVKHGIDYDTSLVNNMNYWPRQIDGVWNFPLAMIKVAGTAKTTLSMDLISLSASQPGRKGRRKSIRNMRTRWSRAMSPTSTTITTATAHRCISGTTSRR